MTKENHERVVVSRRISAPAQQLFELLTDPANHQSIDGSGMLRGVSVGGPLGGIGDTFRMKMHHDERGDYEMVSTVVDFEPGRRVVWEPARWLGS